jgi:hypothetical protein
VGFLTAALLIAAAAFAEWAMLGSNQRPLPCEGFPYCPMRLSSLFLPTLILSLP